MSLFSSYLTKWVSFEAIMKGSWAVVLLLSENSFILPSSFHFGRGEEEETTGIFIRKKSKFFIHYASFFFVFLGGDFTSFGTSCNCKRGRECLVLRFYDEGIFDFWCMGFRFGRSSVKDHIGLRLELEETSVKEFTFKATSQRNWSPNSL